MQHTEGYIVYTGLSLGPGSALHKVPGLTEPTAQHRRWTCKIHNWGKAEGVVTEGSQPGC